MSKLYGILGKSLGHSFSPDYFSHKFQKLHIDAVYRKFEISHIDEVKRVLAESNLVGLNVTIPYKQEVIPYLDILSEEVNAIGAVNTILLKSGKSYGFNTDVVGFAQTLKSLNIGKTKCLVLGTGGAAKSVQYVLNQRNMECLSVSRSPENGQINYEQIDKPLLQQYPCIVNTTPLGMSPNIEKPDLPYRYLSENNILIDLIYQPRVTPFLLEGLERGARIKNGFEMLISQAEASWKIWQTIDN